MDGDLHPCTTYKTSTTSLHNSEEKKNKRTAVQNHSNDVLGKNNVRRNLFQGIKKSVSMQSKIRSNSKKVTMLGIYGCFLIKAVVSFCLF